MARSDFGQAVRRWRDRVTPAAAGLPTCEQDHEQGLRREELALLAGTSVDYVARLEQGRARHPSALIVEALARALRLSGAERLQLFRLAGVPLPGPDMVPTYLTPSVQRLLDRLTGTPVAVYDACWTLLVATAPYAALMGEAAGRSGNERNGVWRHFLGRSGRVRHTPESRRAYESAVVADLRATAARYPDDRRLHRLVAELVAGSERFAELWDRGTAAQLRAAAEVIEHPRIEHPQVGALTLDCDLLTVAGSDLRIMVYSAEPDTEDAQRLALLTG
ncbi:helix-turn-helix domain-containing protein [Kitasatospora sp. LaBMicrA B282]|uniref:helix-turn-helix domain-containing protein n=1 Tax=Kitasatospora sp. LaBMicrA B282 TaxID=3420949 RepID=UPI003D125253